MKQGAGTNPCALHFDDISRLILSTDLPWVDIEIQIAHLRKEAKRLFPQKMELFERVYGSRFLRLWEQ